MAEAKNTLLALVARVERGEEIAITRRGPRNRGSGGPPADPHRPFAACTGHPFEPGSALQLTSTDAAYDELAEAAWAAGVGVLAA
jgi:hypothetical protein